MPLPSSEAVAFDAVESSREPQRLLPSAFALAGVACFFTGLDRYAYAFWSGPAPIELVLLFAGSAVGLLLLYARARMRLLRSPLLAWVLFYFLMATAWAIVAPGGQASSEALRRHYRSAAFVVAFAVFFDDARARRAATLAVAAAVVFASAVNVAELLGVVRFDGQEEVRVGGRAAGLYVNANVSALAIVSGLAITIGRLPPSWRVPLLVAGAAGVAPTFSRSGTLLFVLLAAYLVWRRQVALWPVALACAAAVVLATANADAVSRLLQDVLTQDTRARLRFGGGDSGRIGLAREAWRMFAGAPLLGQGLGATAATGGDLAHNQFLMLAGDHGVLGLLAFPALGLALVASNRQAAPFALVLMLSGIFSHNLLEDPVLLLAMALAAAPDRPAFADPRPEAARGPEPA